MRFRVLGSGFRVLYSGFRGIVNAAFDKLRRGKVGRFLEVGNGTRRRPIRRDYAAAKDEEGGNKRLKTNNESSSGGL